MKKMKWISSAMCIITFTSVNTLLTKAVEVADSGESNAEVEVRAGNLSFTKPPSDTATMPFKEVNYTGKQHDNVGLKEGKNSTIWVSDYRGNDGKWLVNVRDTRQASEEGMNPFVEAMVISILPSGERIQSDSQYTELNEQMNYAFSGEKLESKASLQPIITIPASANAKTYQTVLEWELLPEIEDI